MLMKTPKEAFQFIQQLLNTQRLSLTPPEFAALMEAASIVNKALEPQAGGVSNEGAA